MDQTSPPTSAPSPSGYYESYWRQHSRWSPSQGGIHPEEIRLFQKYLKPGLHCLDYGCGDGRRYGHYLNRLNLQYCGFDISATAVATGQSQGLALRQLTAEGKTDLPSASCETAICFEVLEHLLDPEAALAEIHRVLTPGGRLLVSVPNAACWFIRLEFLLTGFLNPGGSPLTARSHPWRDAHIRFFSKTTFSRLIRQTGFTLLSFSGSPLSFTELPYWYKKKKWHPLLDGLSRPWGWLGRVHPSLFATRLFAVAQKPTQASP